MLMFLFVLNLAISSFNAWSVGRSWTEAKVAGFFPCFMAWMGATMSAVGFTWCYLVAFGTLAGPSGLHKLSELRVEQLYSLGYLAIIGPAIGSGVAIMVQSWMHFWRERTFGSGAVAGYNTFANFENIYGAAQAVPSAWAHVGKLFSKADDSSSDSNASARLVVALAILAVAGGVITTAVIIRTVSKSAARERFFRYSVRNA